MATGLHKHPSKMSKTFYFDDLYRLSSIATCEIKKISKRKWNQYRDMNPQDSVSRCVQLQYSSEAHIWDKNYLIQFLLLSNVCQRGKYCKKNSDSTEIYMKINMTFQCCMSLIVQAETYLLIQKKQKKKIFFNRNCFSVEI